MNITKSIETQLESIVNDADGLMRSAQNDDLSDLPDWDIQGIITRSRAAIEQIVGNNNAYHKQFIEILERERIFDGDKLKMILGVVKSLLHNIKNGYLQSLKDLIHSELFSDYLEMSTHLLEEGYKDAAAVIAGSTLENHIRELCNKNGISTSISTAKGIQNKKADQMNSDLAGANTYNKLDQKNVTAWLDLRNKAAHGKYSEYTKEQVELLIQGIRDFITRNPA
jgi:hypothetical protein